MSWVADLLSIAERIPPTFWGVVVGSFFSLGGVALTNRANQRRLREQLAHDRESRNRDREFALRKDVYLDAAEAISAGFISIGRFANLDIEHDKVTELYLDKAPSIAKVHVIARERTAEAILSLSGELSAVYLSLFAQRVPLSKQKQDLAILDGQIKDFGAVRDQMVELMRQQNLDGQRDDRRWGVLQHTFEFEQGRVNEALQQRGTLAASLYANQLAFMRECVEETLRLGRLLVPVIVAVRNELDLPVNEAEYQGIVEESLSKQRASLDDFIRRARQFVDAQPGASGDAPQAARP